MIQKFYTTSAAVKRLSYASNKGTYGAVGNVMGHLQQATPFVQQQAAQMYTLSHIFWCAADANIQVNDNLEIGSDRYSVKGIWINNYGMNKHKEVHLEKTG